MPERPDRVVPSDSLVRVHLRIANGVSRRNVVLRDLLPSGCTRLLEDATAEAPGPLQMVDSSRRDRATFYAVELPPGIHHLSYLVRATLVGRYFAPGAIAEVLGRPTTMGRSAGDVMVVESR